MGQSGKLLLKLLIENLTHKLRRIFLIRHNYTSHVFTAKLVTPCVLLLFLYILTKSLIRYLSSLPYTTNTLPHAHIHPLTHTHTHTQVCSTLLDELANRPTSLSRRRRQASGSGSGMNSDPTTEPLSYLDRPTQFIVIRVGNTSTNTPPILDLPSDPLIVTEDTPLQYQLQYEDAEGDIVSFYLASLPKLGSANLTTDGQLTFTPCDNCLGIDMLDILIVENPLLDTQVPLSAGGRLLLQIQNRFDNLEVFFYTNVTSSQLTVQRSVTVYMDANRTSPVRVASIAGFDYDGYNDDLSISIQNGLQGDAGSEIWLDVVNVPESLPISFADGTNSILSYADYITFVGSYITYLPRDRNFIGTDSVSIIVQDSNSRTSSGLTIQIEVLPSVCQNGGVCGRSELDPDCTDIARRRNGSEGYNCSCPSGFGGQYCEIQTNTPTPEPTRGEYNYYSELFPIQSLIIIHTS